MTSFRVICPFAALLFFLRPSEGQIDKFQGDLPFCCPSVLLKAFGRADRHILEGSALFVPFCSFQGLRKGRLTSFRVICPFTALLFFSRPSKGQIDNFQRILPFCCPSTRLQSHQKGKPSKSIWTSIKQAYFTACQFDTSLFQQDRTN